MVNNTAATVNFPKFGEDLNCTYYAKTWASGPWQEVKGLVFESNKNAISKILSMDWESKRELSVTLSVKDQLSYPKFAIGEGPDHIKSMWDITQFEGNTITFNLNPYEKKRIYLYISSKTPASKVNIGDFKDINNLFTVSITNLEKVTTSISARLKFVSHKWVSEHKDKSFVKSREEMLNQTYFEINSVKNCEKRVLVGKSCPNPKKSKVSNTDESDPLLSDTTIPCPLVNYPQMDEGYLLESMVGVISTLLADPSLPVNYPETERNSPSKPIDPMITSLIDEEDSFFREDIAATEVLAKDWKLGLN